MVTVQKLLECRLSDRTIHKIFPKVLHIAKSKCDSHLVDFAGSKLLEETTAVQQL